MLQIFVLGVLIGLFLGSFLWTYLTLQRAEEEHAKAIRMARRAWERDAAVVVDGRRIERVVQ